jgi:amino acid adenylation domain-containing protein
MRVEHFLDHSAHLNPYKIALILGEDRYTYRQWLSAANCIGHWLKSQGLQRGQRVVLFLDNSFEAAASLFAALKAGAVFSPVNPTTKADKLAWILNNCRATALITHARLLPLVQSIRPQVPSLKILLVTGVPDHPLADATLWDSALAPAADTPLDVPGIDLDLAMLIYTSGSTGFPKGVMMTHRNIVAAATSITTYLQNTPDDILLNVLPLSFDYGLYQILMTAKLGMTLILEKGFVFPETVLQKLKQEEVTGFPLVPTIASILLQHQSLKPGDFPHLRYISNTAAALPPAHIQKLQDLFPTTRIYSMYGLTECKRCTYLPPEQLKARPGSVGIAIPNTEAWIIDDAGHKLGPNVVGELVIRGSHVMQGYWENPEATDKVLRPGPYPWEKVLHTGDLFKMDEAGFLYFVGRKDDILKTKGEKVSPKEIENVLYALPGVKEAAVVGIPDPILGMALKALLVSAEPGALSEQQVLRHCAAHLEDYMVPKFVEFRVSLPKTSTGKIRRKSLQAEALGNPPENTDD